MNPTKFPDHLIDEIKARVDIVGLVKEYVPLKKAGSANYAACCPFHNERTPSFTVSATKQFYHCFGCGAHGDQIAWMREYLGMPWSEAVARLAEMAGVLLPENDDSGWIKAKASASKTLDKAARWMHRQLMSNARAKAYVLDERKVSPRAAEEFLIGLAPRVLQDYLAAFNEDEIQVLIKAGVLDAEEGGRVYPKMGGRIIFPIRDAAGWVIGFSGRIMGEGKPKYMNSPDSPFFVKRKELFRAPDVRRAARQAGRVVVTEGYFDVLSMFEEDIGYAIAGMGTATTPENLESMFALASEVVFCFDGDRAGREAAWKAMIAALPVIGNNNLASFAFIPDGQDPDEFIKAHGRDAFMALLDSSVPLSKFLIDTYRKRKEALPLERHSALMAEAAGHLKTLKDTTLQNGLVSTLAGVFDVGVTEVRRAAGLPAMLRAVPTAHAPPAMRADAPEMLLLANLIRRPWEAGSLPAGLELQVAGGNEIVESLKGEGVQEGDAGAVFRLFGNTPFWPLVERLLASDDFDEHIPTLARRIEEAWIKRRLVELIKASPEEQDRDMIRKLTARQAELMRESDKCNRL